MTVTESIHVHEESENRDGTLPEAEECQGDWDVLVGIIKNTCLVVAVLVALQTIPYSPCNLLGTVTAWVAEFPCHVTREPGIATVTNGSTWRFRYLVLWQLTESLGEATKTSFRQFFQVHPPSSPSIPYFRTNVRQPQLSKEPLPVALSLWLSG